MNGLLDREMEFILLSTQKFSVDSLTWKIINVLINKISEYLKNFIKIKRLIRRDSLFKNDQKDEDFYMLEGNNAFSIFSLFSASDFSSFFCCCSLNLYEFNLFLIYCSHIK